MCPFVGQGIVEEATKNSLRMEGMQNQSMEYLSEEAYLKRNSLAEVLQALTDPALTRLEADDLSRAVLRCLREIMAADTLVIFLLTEDHTALHIHTVLGLEETVASEIPIPLGGGFARQIVTQGLPLIVHDTFPLESTPPILHEPLHSLLGVPLIIHKQIIGAMYVGMKREYIFTDSDVTLVLHSVNCLAQAFERTLLIKIEHHAVEELIEAQLCAVVELVEAQQRMAIELAEAQQRVAIELVGAQLHTAVELVEAQLHTAVELVEAQQDTAGELLEAQQETAGKLVKAQLRSARELVKAQLHSARELMEEQRRGRIKAFGYMNERETIFNAITDGVIVYNEQEQILRSNRAANHLRDAYGYSFSSEHFPLKRLLGGERLSAKQAIMIHLHSLDDRDVLISVTGAPLYNQQGHLYGAVCVLRDLTTRKHMERSIEILDVLLQMVELLVKTSAPKEQVVRQDDPALVTQQVESNILALAQRLLGCSHAIIIGIHRSTHLLSPLALAGFSAELEQRLRIGITGAHLNLLIKDASNVALLEKQERLPFDITQSPLLQSLFPMSSSPNCYLVPIHIAHHLIGLLGIVFPESPSRQNSGDSALITAISKLCALTLQYRQQITDRDQLMAAKIAVNEQLKQVNKMQNDFISVVSHEFRTALSTIEGFSNLLRSEDYSGEEVKDFANDIYTDAIRLHHMVTDLLDVEQMKSGQMQLHVVWIDMNTLLTTLAKHMEPISTIHHLRLSLDEKLPLLEGDSDKLMQVLTNILSNAIKYSPMGGDILIKSSREGNAVHVSIQDYGIGIASKDIQNVFTSYHRINSTSTRYIEGTGLGLSIAFEIIKLHKGKLWVESSPGHGSTFHLSLPLTREG